MKKTFAILAVVLSIFLFSAVGTAKSVTLRWQTWLTGSLLQSYKDLFKAFEAQSDISVKIEVLPWGEHQVKLETGVATGTAPDLMHLAGQDVGKFIQQGACLDISEYMKKDKLDLKGFWTHTTAYSRGSKVYALAVRGGTSLLYYNVGMFSEAGLASPNDYYKKGEWNWTTFLKTAKSLTKDTNGDGKPDKWGFMVGNWDFDFEQWMTWLLQNGASWVNKSYNKVTMDSPEAIKAFEFYLSLMREHKVAPTPDNMPDDYWSIFPKGQVAMTQMGSWNLKDFSARVPFDWDIASPPKGKKYGVYKGTGSDFFIYKGTKHPKEAWELMKFLASDKAQKIYAKSKNVIPGSIKIMRSDFFKTSEIQHIQVIEDILNYATNFDEFYGYGDVSEAIKAELLPAYMGERSVAESLKAATQAGNKVFDKLLKNKK